VKKASAWIYLPIKNWTTMMVRQYLRQNSLPEPPWYKKGLKETCMCLLPETWVLTPNGFVQIARVEEGDNVFSFGSSLEEDRVTKVYNHTVSERIYMIKSFYLMPLYCTKEHPILVRAYRHRFSSKRGYWREIGEPMWLTAEDLASQWKKARFLSPYKRTNFYIAYPFPSLEKDVPELDERKIKVLGYYISEGSHIRQHRRQGIKPHEGIRFCVKDPNFAKRIANALFEAFGEEPRTVEITNFRGQHFIEVKLYGRAYSEFVLKHIMEQKSEKKRIKWFKSHILYLPKEKQRVLLEAMWEGDGSVFERKTKNEKTSAYSTSSIELALQVQLMLLRLGEIYGINTNSNKNFLVRKSLDQKPYGFIENSVLWTPLKEIEERFYDGDVWNLQVENNQNFITHGGLVHNCGAYTNRKELLRIKTHYPELFERFKELDAQRQKWGRCAFWDGGPISLSDIEKQKTLG